MTPTSTLSAPERLALDRVRSIIDTMSILRETRDATVLDLARTLSPRRIEAELGPHPDEDGPRLSASKIRRIMAAEADQ